MIDDEEKNTGLINNGKYNSFDAQNENRMAQQNDHNNDDDIDNTTNRVESSFLILYEIRNVYYGCFYDAILREIKFLEPIQFSNNNKELLVALIRQFNPQSLLCNSKVKRMLDENDEIKELVKIELKTSKEFSYVEGNLFLEDLLADLKDTETKNINKELEFFLNRLTNKEDYKYYVRFLFYFSRYQMNKY